LAATEIYHVISLGEEKRSEEEVEEEVADLWENPEIHIFGEPSVCASGVLARVGMYLTCMVLLFLQNLVPT
jgi:hypothetical protein